MCVQADGSEGGALLCAMAVHVCTLHCIRDKPCCLYIWCMYAHYIETHISAPSLFHTSTHLVLPFPHPPPSLPLPHPGGACYLCYLCPPLAATTITVTVLLWTVTARYGAFSRRCMKAYQDRLAETNQVAEEALSLITTVRTFGAERREQHRYARQLQKLRYLGLRFALAYLLYLAANSTLYNLNKVVTLFMGGYLLSQGTITGQQLMTFVLYVDMVDGASLVWGGGGGGVCVGAVCVDSVCMCVLKECVASCVYVCGIVCLCSYLFHATTVHHMQPHPHACIHTYLIHPPTHPHSPSPPTRPHSPCTGCV